MSGFRENIPLLVVAITFSIAIFVLYRDLTSQRTRLTTLENAARASMEMYARQQAAQLTSEMPAPDMAPPDAPSPPSTAPSASPPSALRKTKSATTSKTD